MAAPKKATHTVVNRKLYMFVAGKTQHIPAGTEITLTGKQAEKLRDKVKRIGEKKTVDATPAESKAPDADSKA